MPRETRREAQTLQPPALFHSKHPREALYQYPDGTLSMPRCCCLALSVDDEGVDAHPATVATAMSEMKSTEKTDFMTSPSCL
jgi:hypothetical protein